MTAKIKICGIRTEPTYRTTLEAGADYIGLVFFPPSPRAVSPQEAATLTLLRPTGHAIQHVGLFVAPDDALIEETLKIVDLDILQLTDVSAVRAKEIRDRFARPVWRSVSVRKTDDLPKDHEGADAILLDAAPSSAPLPGGNGVAFDWSLLKDWHPQGFWLLAGGLTPDNVQNGIRTTGAPAVDVSSGVERTRGVKDEALIRAFIQAARTAL